MHAPLKVEPGVSYLVMELRGRLGNNLWQFASGLGFARALDARLVFDRHRVPDHDLVLPRLLHARYQEATAAQLRRVGIATYRGPAAGLARSVRRRSTDYSRRVLHRRPAQMILYDGADQYRPDLFELDLPAAADNTRSRAREEAASRN